MKHDFLTWEDILLLHVVVEYVKEHGHAPKKLEIFDPATRGGLFNSFLKDNHIPRIFAWPAPGMRLLFEGMGKLRHLGFIEPDSYCPTPAGDTFLRDLGADWSQWPLRVPFVNSSQIDFAWAEYAPPIG